MDCLGMFPPGVSVMSPDCMFIDECTITGEMRVSNMPIHLCDMHGQPIGADEAVTIVIEATITIDAAWCLDKLNKIRSHPWVKTRISGETIAGLKSYYAIFSGKEQCDDIDDVMGDFYDDCMDALATLNK